MKKKVVIIGAGPAGLTAGYELLKRAGDAYDVIILEQDALVGGISKTVCCNGFHMDLGGHRLFSKSEDAVTWWKQVLPAEELLTVARSSKILYRGKLLDYPLTISKQTVSGLGIKEGTMIIASYLKSQGQKVDESTLEGFYKGRFGKRLYELFFRDYTEKVWGRDPAEMPADWGRQRVKGLSMAHAIAHAVPPLRRLVHEDSLTSSFYYPRYGIGQLWEQTAQQIRAMGGQILLGEQVSSVEISGGKARKVMCRSGKSFHSDYLISSMPLHDLIEGIDAAPDDVSAVGKSLRYRALVVVGIVVRKTDIEGVVFDRGNRSSDQWLYVQDSRVKMGRIQIMDNWSPFLNGVGHDYLCLSMEYFCQEGDSDWLTPDDGWLEQARKELAQLHILRPGSSLMGGQVYRVGKAYPCYWDGYFNLETIREYLNTIDNLLIIGRNGQHRYNNMDHSMMTGFRAVDCLLGRGSKSSVWDVNSEKEYHEAQGNELRLRG